MGAIFAGILPEPLCGIEFWRVRRQLVDLQPVAVGSEPIPYHGFFVVGGIVLDEDRALAPIPSCQLLQKCQIGCGIEDRVLLIVEAGIPQFDGAEDLDALAFSGHRDLRGMSQATPCHMQG